MTEIKDLRVGDEVTLTIKAKVTSCHGNDAEFEYSDYLDDIYIAADALESGAVTIERAPRPLPAEPGIYIPRGNSADPEGSYIYRYSANEGDTDMEWKVDTGDRIESGISGRITAEYAHEYLGGLVRLVPEQ